MKGLEALYNPKQALNNIRFNYFESKRNEDANVEHFWFDTIEKELKALEIIKNKNVDVNSLRFSHELDWYNRYNHYLLTQEEYDLLKEVLL